MKNVKKTQSTHLSNLVPEGLDFSVAKGMVKAWTNFSLKVVTVGLNFSVAKVKAMVAV